MVFNPLVINFSFFQLFRLSTCCCQMELCQTIVYVGIIMIQNRKRILKRFQSYGSDQSRSASDQSRSATSTYKSDSAPNDCRNWNTYISPSTQKIAYYYYFGMTYNGTLIISSNPKSNAPTETA